MKLYTYSRSSAAFRVRIALNLKGLEWEPAFVHLGRGEQNGPAYRALNPQRLVPALEDGAALLTQSLAILEYLEERYAEPPLLPRAPAERARVRSLALLVACEIHPLNNLRVLQYLRGPLAQPEEAVLGWYRHWIAQGFERLEAELARGPRGRYAHGDTPTLADCCLVPQVFNAKRYNCDVSPYPAVMRVFEACMQLDAFARAQPALQPDAEAQ